MKASVKQTVGKILKRNKRCRDDDRLLQLAVWRERGLTLTPKQTKTFLSLPSAESIARRRREFRQKYPESPEVLERRQKAFKDYSNEFSLLFEVQDNTEPIIVAQPSLVDKLLKRNHRL